MLNYIMKIVLLGSMLLIIGCGGLTTSPENRVGYNYYVYWYAQDGKGKKETIQAIKQCKYEAESALASKLKEGFFDQSHLMDSCMDVKGYRNSYNETKSQ